MSITRQNLTTLDPDLAEALIVGQTEICEPYTTEEHCHRRHQWGRLREGAESYAKALASDILR